MAGAMYDARVKPLDPADLDFFGSAPLKVSSSARVSVSPARVFASFSDAPEWTRWWPMMTNAAWTSGSGGVGAEREVAVRGLGRFRERMIAWQPGARFAFTMIASNSPLASQIAEDYQLIADGDGTRIDWVIAARPRTLGKLAAPIIKRLMAAMFQRGIGNLDRLLTAN